MISFGFLERIWRKIDRKKWQFCLDVYLNQVFTGHGKHRCEREGVGSKGKARDASVNVYIWLLTCCPVYLSPFRLTFHSISSWYCSSLPPHILTTKHDTDVSKRSGSIAKSKLRHVGFWKNTNKLNYEHMHGQITLSCYFKYRYSLTGHQ